MRDFTEVRKQIERLTRTIGEHPTYEVQQACLVNALSISSYLLGVLEGEDMVREWRRANDCNTNPTGDYHRVAYRDIGCAFDEGVNDETDNT